MTRKRILFVDDEPSVLDGLQNILRKYRRDWDMVFATGGDSALEALAGTAAFDVIVSDMRMPGMDGAALLRQVQADYPKMARLVLSGHADRDAAIRALPVAHQYLSKPCDPAVLHEVIEQTCRLQGLLHDDGVRVLVGRLDKLPSVPRCYLELSAAVSRPEGGLAAVARIVEKDPAMSAKVLQLVNSAYFGSSQRITSVERAVVYLGIELIQGLALTAQVFDTLKEVGAPSARWLDDLQEHSLMTARLARRFIPDQQRAEETFAAAIVHDIGRIVLALGFPDKYAQVDVLARERDCSIVEVERELFGVAHPAAGAYLLGVWGLPSSIVETVAYHHEPRLAPAGARDVVAAVHAADALLQEGAHAVAPSRLLDTGFLEQAGFAAVLPQWQLAAQAQLAALEGH